MHSGLLVMLDFYLLTFVLIVTVVYILSMLVRNVNLYPRSQSDQLKELGMMRLAHDVGGRFAWILLCKKFDWLSPSSRRFAGCWFLPSEVLHNITHFIQVI